MYLVTLHHCLKGTSIYKCCFSCLATLDVRAELDNKVEADLRVVEIEIATTELLEKQSHTELDVNKGRPLRGSREDHAAAQPPASASSASTSSPVQDWHSLMKPCVVRLTRITSKKHLFSSACFILCRMSGEKKTYKITMGQHVLGVL